MFTLAPQRRRYAWIGVEQGERTAASAHMFMAASKQTLLIGGGLVFIITLGTSFSVYVFIFFNIFSKSLV